MLINKVKDLFTGRGAPPEEAAFDRAEPASRAAEAAAATALPPAPERAEETATPSAESPPTGRTDALEDYFERLDAAFARFGASASAARPSPGEPEHRRDGVGELQSAPEGPRSGANPFERRDRESAGAEGPSGEPRLDDAFTALFPTEQGLANHGDVTGDRPPMGIPEDLVDHIVERVIARMADEEMRRVFLETAERLVREEIERIKRLSSSGHAPTAG